MMWNWMVSALSLGATLVLFDGSPFYPDPGALFQLAENEKITIFGTSAKYIDSIRKMGLKPKDEYDLGSVRTILSTGSPLSEENFRFVYNDVKRDVCLSSISGGKHMMRKENRILTIKGSLSAHLHFHQCPSIFGMILTERNIIMHISMFTSVSGSTAISSRSIIGVESLFMADLIPP
jgi:hypothetical protein